MSNNADKSMVMVNMPALEPRLGLFKTSEGGRSYVADFFRISLGRHDFERYIDERLAADFACALSDGLCQLFHLAANAQQPVSVAVPDADRLHAKDALLMWNRRHEQPPIQIGFEYGVADAFLSMLAAAPHPVSGEQKPEITPEIAAAVKWVEDNGGTPAEFLSYQLLVKRTEVLGRPLTWAEAIELTALTTGMPDDEKRRLLAMDDAPPAVQDVTGLLEALEKISSQSIHDDGSEWSAEVARNALAAHRAQAQGVDQ